MPKTGRFGSTAWICTSQGFAQRRWIGSAAHHQVQRSAAQLINRKIQMWQSLGLDSVVPNIAHHADHVAQGAVDCAGLVFTRLPIGDLPWPVSRRCSAIHQRDRCEPC